MFDYARRAQLALSDLGRRVAMKIVGGLVIAVGVGFLLAALWSWLAVTLDWGPTMASLAIGGGFALIGLLLMLIGGRKRHEMPTTDDLKREVEARAALATEIAVERARVEATKVMALAETKVHSVLDEASDRASRFASDTEQRMYGAARNAARSVGLTSGNIAVARDHVETATDKARHAMDHVRSAAGTNGGSMAKLVGAFSVGVAIASKLQEARRSQGDAYPDFERDDML